MFKNRSLWIAGAGLLVAFAVVLVVVLTQEDGDKGPKPRKAPFGFVGVVADGPLLSGTSLAPSEKTTDELPLAPSAARREFDLMVSSGVEAARFVVRWSEIQPVDRIDKIPAKERARFRQSGGIPSDFKQTDFVVTEAAKRHINLLPTVLGTPGWAAQDPAKGTSSPPKDPDLYGQFLKALIDRYGPNGTLWREQPQLPKRPIRTWQIWNEPDLRRYWSVAKFAPGYVKLLKTAYRAVKSTDPKATVMLASFTNYSWESLQTVYRAGGQDFFDQAAINPFSAKPAGVIKIVEAFRRVMDYYGDRGKQIVVTELTWTSARDRNAGKVAKLRFLDSTERDQAGLLDAAFRGLLSRQQKLKLAGIYWYTWLSPKPTSTDSFDYAGLRRVRSRTETVSKPALKTFQTVSQEIAGCEKESLASRCKQP